jgi:hypothetical protein
MITLSIEHRDAINACIQSHREACETLGLIVTDHSDPEEFAAERATFPGYVHPSLDPVAGALIAPGDFMWIKLAAHGVTFGVIAARRYVGRLDDLIQTRRLWAHDAPTLAHIEPVNVVSLNAHRIAGTISLLQGGMILDDATRGLRLSVHLMWMVRLATLRTWQEDWQVGLITEETHAKNLHLPKFGYHGAEILFDGGMTHGACHDREILVYADGRKVASQLPCVSARWSRMASIAETS